jgi:hypothetical protein
VVSHTATAPSTHIPGIAIPLPSRMWTLHFAAPANYSIHYLLLCGGFCCTRYEKLLRLVEREISMLQSYNLHRYISTLVLSPETETQTKINEPTKPTQTSASLSLALTHPTSHAFSRNGSAHERLLRRVVVLHVFEVAICRRACAALSSCIYTHHGAPSRRIWAVSAFVLQPAGEWIVGWVGKAEGWNDGGKKNGEGHVCMYYWSFAVLGDGDKAIVR